MKTEKAPDAVQAMHAFLDLAKPILDGNGEIVGATDKIRLVAQFLNAKSPEEVAEYMRLLTWRGQPNGVHHGEPVAATAVPEPVRRFPRVLWHSKRNPRTGLKHTWIATWQDMTLRVERHKDSRVYFDGFLNDEHVTRDKVLSLVKAQVEARALAEAKRGAG